MQSSPKSHDCGVWLPVRADHARDISGNLLSRSLAALGFVVFVAACTTTGLTATGPTVPSQEAPCAFQILTAAPSVEYVEVGVVNAHLGDYGSNAFSTLADFKKEITPYVCRAGGDMAVAYANDAGIYIRATVLRSTGAKPASASRPAAGCQFDTQCKGQRVCVRGECMDPSPR
jgi:hypothetical protein